MIYKILPKRSIVVGIIDFENCINEYAVESEKNYPSINKLGKCKVEVYDNEGMVPHFHIYGKSAEICVCLKSNKYFSHSPRHIQFSNLDQTRELNDWLSRYNVKISRQEGQKITNYQALIKVWNMLNEHAQLKPDTKQPDYGIMSEEYKKDR